MEGQVQFLQLLAESSSDKRFTDISLLEFWDQQKDHLERRLSFQTWAPCANPYMILLL